LASCVPRFAPTGGGGGNIGGGGIVIARVPSVPAVHHNIGHGQWAKERAGRSLPVIRLRAVGPA
jgi:hypothetical protein